jgi:2-phosphosulfolactate phosphatase
MKKVNVVLTQSLIKDELDLKGKNVIIIDVLRSSTTMIVALTHGAKDNSLLCGERKGKVIEGFALGNSPLEYKEEVVKDKVLVFSTTNGTSSIVKSKYSKTCVIASFINLVEVIKYVKLLNDDLFIICSGKLNNFCLEDLVCAGLIIEQVNNSSSVKNKFGLNDAETAAINLAKIYALVKGKPSQGKILKMFLDTEQGKYLNSLGFGEDLTFCSNINSYPFLPIFKDGIIKLAEKMEVENIEKSKMKKINLSDKSNN